MFFRTKKSGPRSYLQVVENHWRDGRPQQTVLATLGRLDELQASGQVDSLLASGARFAQKLLVLSEHQQQRLPVIHTRHWGAPLIFEKLWRETGCQAVIKDVLRGRQFEFAVERAVFLTVLHRLLSPGSDRAAERWKVDYVLDEIDDLELHQLYRAMGWLGEQLPAAQQQGSSKLVPRCTKDVIEEQLFARRRDLFTEVEVVFFDTTSLYFEGRCERRHRGVAEPQEYSHAGSYCQPAPVESSLCLRSNGRTWLRRLQACARRRHGDDGRRQTTRGARDLV